MRQAALHLSSSLCTDVTVNIIDATLSPDNRWMIYSSINPYVYLVPTKYSEDSQATSYNDQQVMLDFSNQGSDDAGVRWRSGVRGGAMAP